MFIGINDIERCFRDKVENRIRVNLVVFYLCLFVYFCIFLKVERFWKDMY